MVFDAAAAPAMAMGETMVTGSMIPAADGPVPLEERVRTGKAWRNPPP